jgi:hypothetical protein
MLSRPDNDGRRGAPVKRARDSPPSAKTGIIAGPAAVGDATRMRVIARTMERALRRLERPWRPKDRTGSKWVVRIASALELLFVTVWIGRRF